MSTEMASRYAPGEAQEYGFSLWAQSNVFHNEPDDRSPYSIVIPPPNVTGALHMGHALNNTIQDVLVRWRRMQGFNTLWVPGTDHAGIATQAVVERRLKEEQNQTRHDIGREGLVERIWAWKEDYEKRILNQLRQIGSSCDWSRTRFTLDPICARAVRDTFFSLFQQGYIYRGKRLVNWDTHLQTAVADDEIFHETVKGSFWTFRYPIIDGGATSHICISTTRPETLLGDTAVAVHPDDPRYKHLIGKSVQLPLTDRTIPIIADGKLVDPEFGTGCVKVTPAHDPNDYQTGLRHNLEMINVLNPDGTINANGGEFEGLERYAARELLVSKMEALGLLEKVEDYETEVGHSDRSKTPIEPFLSDQWFVRMNHLAQISMDAVNDGRVEIRPERYAKSYLDWLGEKRDWCISRQLWWGHRIPVWRAEANTNEPEWEKSLDIQNIDALLQGTWADSENISCHVVHRESGDTLKISNVNALSQHPAGEYDILVCLKCDNADQQSRLSAVGFEQDPDVLDTWFSSALWPHSTLGWPEETADLKFYYPTSVLVTSRDIITLWVARMVMTGLFNRGEVPFRRVFIHPKILDGFGQAMSKSKGNGVDPLDIIERYGTDALRFALTSLTTETQDARMPVGYECPECSTIVAQKIEHQRMKIKSGKKPRIKCPKCKTDFQFSSPNFDPDPGEAVAKVVSDRFEQGRNFANKLWNASRFALMNLEGYEPGELKLSDLADEEKWILSRLSHTEQQVAQCFESFKFSEAARTIYDFSWSEFCDWYIEMSKLRLQDPATRPIAQRVLAAVLDRLLRLLHPVTPFLTEQIWKSLNGAAPSRGIPTPTNGEAMLITAAWPVPQGWDDEQVEKRMNRLQDVIRAVRNIRNQFKVDSKAKVACLVRCSSSIAPLLQTSAPFVQSLAQVESLDAGPDVIKPDESASHVSGEWELYVPLTGLIDRDAEIERNRKQLEQIIKQLKASHAKLSNEKFTANAPPEIVEQHRQTASDLENQKSSIEEILRALGAD